ncbi:MAG: prepilin-type N-terminal cleavage/methylation domain-containing protein [Elusimicrobiota bacterium]
MKMNKKGFTLIELMIVVAIIGILAAIAIPKFADLINKSKEGATKGALSTVRSAIQIYYGDNEGWFPTEATSLTSLTTDGKYLNSIPMAKLPTRHADSATIANSVTDAAGWTYYNAHTTTAEAALWGTFVANCSHMNIAGTAQWTSF